MIEKSEYDGLGRRIIRTILSASTNDVQHSYYNEDWQELEVRREVSGTESANPLEQLVWHPYYIDALATRFYDSDVTNSSGVVQHYFTEDANFNITAAVDTSAAVVERYEYTPYGKLTFLDANFATDADGLSDIANSHTYTGRRFDEATGLYHYRHRQYSADLGNFVTRDPMIYKGKDENLYRYVTNRITILVDPLGLQLDPDPGETEQELVMRKLEKIDTCVCNLCNNTVGANALFQFWLYDIDHQNNANGGNAFRHCVATCQSSKGCGDDCARYFWDGREDGNRIDSLMDLANNEVGYGCADSPSCWDCCMSKWTSGELTCIVNGTFIPCPPP